MHLACIWIVCHLSAKNYQNRWKFDEVLTKTNLLSFFWDTVYSYKSNISKRGYWHQRADERLGDPPPKVDPGTFSGQRQGWNTPQEDPLGVHCFCVCSGNVLLGDRLGG